MPPSAAHPGTLVLTGAKALPQNASELGELVLLGGDDQLEHLPYRLGELFCTGVQRSGCLSMVQQQLPRLLHEIITSQHFQTPINQTFG